jgi:hypothetical protein
MFLSHDAFQNRASHHRLSGRSIEPVAVRADYQSAIQQAASLRYDASGGSGRRRGGANLSGARSIAPRGGSQANGRSNAPRSGRSADCQSAVSPTGSRRGGRWFGRLTVFARLADCQSAIRQAASLRYDASGGSGRRRGGANLLGARSIAPRGGSQANWRSNAPRSGRSADCQSAVSPTGSRQGGRLVGRPTVLARLADWQSAIRQAASLRYGANGSSGRRRGGANLSGARSIAPREGSQAGWRSNAPRSVRSADCQSAVSPTGCRRGVRWLERLTVFARLADWQSAIRQAASLRYD